MRARHGSPRRAHEWRRRAATLPKRRGGADAAVAEIVRMVGVDVEIDLVDMAGRAVGEGERAGGRNGIAVLRIVALRRRRQIDRGDAGLLQGFQFAGIDRAVAVAVDPHA